MEPPSFTQPSCSVHATQLGPAIKKKTTPVQLASGTEAGCSAYELRHIYELISAAAFVQIRQSLIS